MKQDTVLFCLHGFLRTGPSMWWIAHQLKTLKYTQTYTPTFGLHLHSLQDNATSLHTQMQNALTESGATNIDVVTYSMGGLLLRALLTLYPETPVQRVVMIAPPNQGAEMAELVRRWIPVHELGWDPLAPLLPNAPTQLDEPAAHIPVGIIAGIKYNGTGYNPLLSEDNDGKVCLTETKLKRDHQWITVKGRHPSLILHPTPIHQTKHFLQHQRFDQ